MKAISIETLMAMVEALAARVDRLEHNPRPVRAESEGALRAKCDQLGIAVVAGTVSEGDAARLLGRSKYTLRNRRAEDCPIPYVRQLGRVRYRLDDLAKVTETNRNALVETSRRRHVGGNAGVPYDRFSRP